MNSFLSITAYESAESAARIRLPNRLVAAFQPVTFEKAGYPARASTEQELAKYVDVMQEHRFGAIWREKIGGLTGAELAMCEKVLGIVAAHTSERFGQVILPRGALLSSLSVFRAFEAIYGRASPKPAVLELGPGSGYLGLMLGLSGYGYIGFEVAQAFYLWHSGLMRTAFNVGLAEFATGESHDGAVSAIHLPWWRAQLLPPFSIVTCNAMLGEMHPMALQFMLARARNEFKSAKGRALFLFHDWGFYQVGNPSWAVNAAFHEHKFGMLHNDDRITAYGLADHWDGHVANVPNVSYPPNADVLVARQYGALPISNIWEPMNFSSPSNPVSSILSQMKGGAHTFDELRAIYTKLGVDPNADNGDEKFMRECAA